jgi:hypothetical protein
VEIDPAQLFDRRRPGGRVLTLDGYPHRGQPIMLTEFGGIACAAAGEPGGWGYSVATDSEDLAARYATLLGIVRRMSIFAGFCYTQLADTYQERNGLLDADRRPKFALERIADGTRGPRLTRQLQDDHPRQGLAADFDVDLGTETT